MKLNKKLVVLAAAGALSAVTALPAMAFENEFHGIFNLKYFLSNYEQGGGGNILATPVTGTGVVTAPGNTAYNTTDSLRTNNYFEQRARIFYTAKASDDLKLVTGFEIDSIWGDRAQGGISPTVGTNPTAGATAVPTVNTAAFRNSGGALEADAVNLETKWVYLDFKIPSTPTRVTAGIQPFKDQLKGIFLDADVAGVITSTKLDALTLNLGYARGYDQSTFAVGTSALPKGNENLDIGIIEAKYAVSKNMNAGFAYYLYSDGRPTNYGGALGAPVGATAAGAVNSVNGATVTGGTNTAATMIHTFGLTGDAKVGPATLSGFLAYQGGVIRGVDGTNDSAYLNAFAYNLAAKAAVGPGTLKTALLFTSGNDQNASDKHSKHLTGWFGTSQSPDGVWSSTAGTCTYNESGMMLLNRNAVNNNTTTDNAIIYNTSNGSTPINAQGMYLYTLGYDASLTPKLFTNVNVGAAWAAHTNNLKPVDKATTKQNATNYMGTEVNLETGYKLYDNLTARFQAAYVVLGGYYKGASSAGSATAAKDPENPYTARVILNYTF